MRALITGGAGFIGSNFVRMALSGKFPQISKVLVLDKLTYAGNRENLASFMAFSALNFVEGDICDVDLVCDLITNVDVVINFAAETHVDRSISDAGVFVETNVVGVQVILEAMKRSKRDIRLLQVSTDEVYGSLSTGSWSEQSPLVPNSPYSASKASGDLLALSYVRTHGLDVVIARPSNTYGQFQYPEKLIPLCITNLISGKHVPLYGDGQNVREWLYVDDLCQGIYAAVLKGKTGQVYNIGGGVEMANIEVAKMILQSLNKDDSMIEFVKDRKGHDFRYSMDWTKAKQELDYQPWTDFKNGLEKTVDWYRENEHWWRSIHDKREI